MPEGIEGLAQSTKTEQQKFSDRLENTVATSTAEVAIAARFKAVLRHLIEAVISVKQQRDWLQLKLAYDFRGTQTEGV